MSINSLQTPSSLDIFLEGSRHPWVVPFPSGSEPRISDKRLMPKGDVMVEKAAGRNILWFTYLSSSSWQRQLEKKKKVMSVPQHHDWLGSRTISAAVCPLCPHTKTCHGQPILRLLKEQHGTTCKTGSRTIVKVDTVFFVIFRSVQYTVYISYIYIYIHIFNVYIYIYACLFSYHICTCTERESDMFHPKASHLFEQ